MTVVRYVFNGTTDTWVQGRQYVVVSFLQGTTLDAIFMTGLGTLAVVPDILNDPDWQLTFVGAVKDTVTLQAIT